MKLAMFSTVQALLLAMGGYREIPCGRRLTCDAQDPMVFPFRMGAGMQGDVSRRGSRVEPCLIDSTKPPTYFGQGVIADGAAPNGVRVAAAGDSGLTDIYGVTVRPFPFQQSVATNYGAATFGGEAPPATGVVDVLRSGYIMVLLQGAAAAAKGLPVKMCIVAGTGYVVGGFSADSVSGTFITLGVKTTFNGPADANGIVELAFNI